MSDVPAIFTDLAAVMADVQAVTKRDRNDHQKFMFRGIDAVMNAVGPALRTHQVIVTPDVRSVTYEDVTTSTGKASTACRVEVAYTFYATDGSSITTSVAGEAWDHGDKACPKAMSVAFRTALLQALCLPTDEPDPDTHTYERSTVDMSQVNAAIGEAQALKIEGDYDGTREWAAQSQANADAAASKLRKAIAAKRAEQAEEKSGTEDQAPTEEAGEGDTPEDPAALPSTSGGTDTPGTPEGADEAPAGDGDRASSPAPNPCSTCGPEPRDQKCPDCPADELPHERADRLGISAADQMLKVRELAGPLKATVPARRQYVGTGKCHPGLTEAFVAYLDEVEAGLSQPVGS